MFVKTKQRFKLFFLVNFIIQEKGQKSYQFSKSSFFELANGMNLKMNFHILINAISPQPLLQMYLQFLCFFYMNNSIFNCYILNNYFVRYFQLFIHEIQEFMTYIALIWRKELLF